MSHTGAILAYGGATFSTLRRERSGHSKVVGVLRKHNINVIDTARLYGRGTSEAYIGENNLGNEFRIITKAPGGFIAGSLSREGLYKNLKASLLALNVPRVWAYLLHAPDNLTTIEETMDTVQELYAQGYFEEFGLSNFDLEDVEKIHAYASSRGYVLPTIYQSNYNLIARKNETTLFPLLRRLNMSIQAYSPVAGGFLVKSRIDIEQGVGRWNSKSFFGLFYGFLYRKPSTLSLLDDLEELSAKSGVSKLGIAYRWVRYHSALDGSLGDLMLMGGRSVAHVEETLRELEKGPLDEWIVSRLDEMWKSVEADAPVDNRDALLQMMK